MMLPQVSSELERMWLCGRSVWQTTLGLRGSETSTAVKFFGALSCASQRMRRPSGAICTDMPSPMPPKPSSRWWESSLKFQVTVPSAPGLTGLAADGWLLDGGFRGLRGLGLHRLLFGNRLLGSLLLGTLHKFLPTSGLTARQTFSAFPRTRGGALSGEWPAWLDRAARHTINAPPSCLRSWR